MNDFRDELMNRFYLWSLETLGLVLIFYIQILLLEES